MKQFAALCLSVCLLLSGCASVFDGNYISTTPHQEQSGLPENVNTQVDEYDELLATLISLAERGSRNGMILVPNYDQEQIESDMEKAAKLALVRSPIAAYAVENITWELGTNSGQRAVAVSINYYHDRSEILKIRRVNNVEEAIEVLYREVEGSSPGVVMYIEDYSKVDYVHLVEQHAFQNPQKVMETPQVVANIYPKTGASRVVELKFTYQNTREDLQLFKSQVLPHYASSQYYITKDAPDQEKYSQLYSFLMHRGFGEYTIETSITPAYSLLWHGTGDSRAFATLYSAICRLSDLDCQVIIGTHNGEPWYWNLVKVGNDYYHLDLLQSYVLGEFRLTVDKEMSGYVWNYSAYPATPEEMDPQIQETQPVETEPTEVPPTEQQPT